MQFELRFLEICPPFSENNMIKHEKICFSDRVLRRVVDRRLKNCWFNSRPSRPCFQVTLGKALNPTSAISVN